ncbi:uncharacterized protein LOC143423808 [Xylocopa sonorina]|uniref:uncharacterized protein LOC143423808 n=1 Tax=Xylocopa sonorina TaxID=1818115 RepID=UPI00403A8B70
MAGPSDPRSFLRRCIIVSTLVVAVHVAGQEICDKAKCPGPLTYYQDLGCTPVYNNSGDCCAREYNCSHLKELSQDKCYVNGHEYDIGEHLRSEDKNPCDVGCTCMSIDNRTASFMCALVNCYLPGPQHCFHRYNHDNCCPSSYDCPKEGERATCEVDGKTYLDGDYFRPKSDPDIDCYCMSGYKGENIEPFCRKPKRPYCSPLFKHAEKVHRNCAPVPYDSRIPLKYCSYSYRCQNANDVVIRKRDASNIVFKEESVCHFGDLVVHIGEELSQGTGIDSVCVRCVCEVPPFLTCKHLSDSECESE